MATEFKLPILKGTQAAYNAIAVKNPELIYITKDMGNIYLGNVRLGGTVIGKTVEDIAFSEETKAFTVTYSDGETKELNLVLESVMQDIAYDPETHIVTFTLAGGATTTIDLSDLVPVTVSEIDGGTSDAAIANAGAIKAYVGSVLETALTIGEF